MTSDIIPYDIVYCTSQDEGHPVTALGGGIAGTVTARSPTGGWQSAVNGNVPQTLVLRFPGVAWLHQLRILSHESKIASQVEIRVFKPKRAERSSQSTLDGGAPGESFPSFRSARFTKLGAAAFNDNVHSNHRAKERKTVHLKTEAYFVKLLFDRPYSNDLNTGNQIGIYSIECIGYIVTPVTKHVDRAIGALVGGESSLHNLGGGEDGSSSRTSSIRPRSQHVEESHRRRSERPTVQSDGPSHPSQNPLQQQPQSRRNSSVSEVSRGGVPTPSSVSSPRFTNEDDAFGNTTDFQAFRSVRILEFEEFFLRRSEELLCLKEQAIAVEDFETATRCRDNLNHLNSLSRAIYQLEQEKVQTIIEEDFDRAKEVRNEMNRLVQRAFAEAKIPGSTSARAHPPPPPSAAGEFAQQQHSADTSHADSIPFRSDDDASDNGRVDGPNRSIDVEVEEQFDAEPQEFPEVRRTATPSQGWADHRRDSEAGREGRAGSRQGRRVSSVGFTSDAMAGFDERPVGGMGTSTPWPENVDDIVVSRAGPDDAVLRIRDLPADSTENLVSREILAATGEEENGTVVQPTVTLDLRLLTATVGPFPAACLVSRRFKLREAGLTVLTEAMFDHYQNTAAAVEDAVLRFLDYNGYGLQDSIPNVVFAACTFVRMVLFDECNVFQNISPQVIMLLPRLLTRAADPLPRVRDEASTTLALYVKTPAAPVAPYIAAFLADPVDKDKRKVPTSNPRAQQARLGALQVLLESERGVPALEGSVGSVITKLLIPAVNHANFDVRDLGTSLFRMFVDLLGVNVKEKDLAKINNPAIRDVIMNGRRGKRS